MPFKEDAVQRNFAQRTVITVSLLVLQMLRHVRSMTKITRSKNFLKKSIYIKFNS